MAAPMIRAINADEERQFGGQDPADGIEKLLPGIVAHPALKTDLPTKHIHRREQRGEQGEVDPRPAIAESAFEGAEQVDCFGVHDGSRGRETSEKRGDLGPRFGEPRRWMNRREPVSVRPFEFGSADLHPRADVGGTSEVPRGPVRTLSSPSALRPARCDRCTSWERHARLVRHIVARRFDRPGIGRCRDSGANHCRRQRPICRAARFSRCSATKGPTIRACCSICLLR